MLNREQPEHLDQELDKAISKIGGLFEIYIFRMVDGNELLDSCRPSIPIDLGNSAVYMYRVKGILVSAKKDTDSIKLVFEAEGSDFDLGIMRFKGLFRTFVENVNLTPWRE